MSGIAEVLVNLGFRVSGSDLKRSNVTDRLQHLPLQGTAPGVPAGQPVHLLDEGDRRAIVTGAEEPPDPDADLDQIAKALDVSPDFFFDFRASSVADAISRHPKMVDRLFSDLQSRKDKITTGAGEGQHSPGGS